MSQYFNEYTSTHVVRDQKKVNFNYICTPPEELNKILTKNLGIKLPNVIVPLRYNIFIPMWFEKPKNKDEFVNAIICEELTDTVLLINIAKLTKNGVLRKTSVNEAYKYGMNNILYFLLSSGPQIFDTIMEAKLNTERMEEYMCDEDDEDCDDDIDYDDIDYDDLELILKFSVIATNPDSTALVDWGKAYIRNNYQWLQELIKEGETEVSVEADTSYLMVDNKDKYCDYEILINQNGNIKFTYVIQKFNDMG